MRRPVIFALMLALAVTGSSAAARRQADPPAVTPAIPDYRASGDGPVYEAVDPAGHVWATWAYRRGLELDIAVSQQIGRTWTAPEIIGVPAVDDLDPRIAFLGDGTPVLIWWQRASDPSQNRVMYSMRVNNAWSAPVVLDPSAISGIPTVLAVNDAIVVVFVDPGGEVHTSRIRVKPRAGTIEGESGTNGPDPMPSSY